MAKNEFSSRVAQLCDENSFRTLTDLRWFCAGESETNRRAALFDLVEDVSDEDVLASDPAFVPLADALGGLTVEEAKAAYQKQRRNLQTKAKTTPARIDEQKRTISEYEAVDFAALRTRRDELAGQESAAREALEQLRSKAGTSALLPQRDGLRMQLEALESQNAGHRPGVGAQPVEPAARPGGHPGVSGTVEGDTVHDLFRWHLPHLRPDAASRAAGQGHG